MSLLICEGICNPDLPSVDAAVRANRMPDGRVYLTDDLRDRQRRLKHTPHAKLAPGHYECEVCGRPRWCGAHG